jgi:hypothetical protein
MRWRRDREKAVKIRGRAAACPKGQAALLAFVADFVRCASVA